MMGIMDGIPDRLLWYPKIQEAFTERQAEREGEIGDPVLYLRYGAAQQMGREMVAEALSPKERD